MTEIVSVWLDDDKGWIVDTESRVLKTFPPTDKGFEAAVSYAKRAGIARGCDVRLCNSVMALTMRAGEYEADTD